MGSYRDLKVWEKVHHLCLAILKRTRQFPASERYELSSQLRKAAVSVGSNIVEGSGRQSDGDMGRFLQIARGSLWELQYQLLVCRDLGYLQEEEWVEFTAQADEVSRMLVGLLTHLRKGARQSKRGRNHSPKTAKAGV